MDNTAILPQGIGGFEPSVSLSYSSLVNNSVLGVGWSLDATSEINRCRKFYEQDGFYQEVTFTDSDAICFDGQRLILTKGANLSSGAEYRVQNDATTKVTYNASGLGHFTVHKQNGETSTYGQTDDSLSVKNNQAYT